MKNQIGIPIVLFFLLEAICILIFREYVVAAFYFALFFIGSLLALIYRLKLKFSSELSALRFIMFSLGFVGAGMTAAFVVLFLKLPNPFAQDHLLAAIILVGLAPVTEELLFRYAIFDILLQKNFSNHATIVITSILFSLFHLISLLTLPSAYAIFVTLQSALAFFIGIALGAIRVRSGSILPTIALHLLFNTAYLIGSL